MSVCHSVEEVVIEKGKSWMVRGVVKKLFAGLDPLRKLKAFDGRCKHNREQHFTGENSHLACQKNKAS